jgi:hypothetical protein
MECFLAGATYTALAVLGVTGILWLWNEIEFWGWMLWNWLLDFWRR